MRLEDLAELFLKELSEHEFPSFRIDNFLYQCRGNRANHDDDDGINALSEAFQYLCNEGIIMREVLRVPNTHSYRITRKGHYKVEELLYPQ